MGKSDNKGRSSTEHYTKIVRNVIETEAFRAMSPKAQILYVWLRLEWKGPKNNNNSKIMLSCRQAADFLGISENTAMRAFHELQAKGFIVVKKLGALGLVGKARGTSFELTEIGVGNEFPRRLYRNWSPGNDFEVIRVSPNNPEGRNGN